MANETSVRFWGFMGFWWVASSAAVIAVMNPFPGSSIPVRISFYGISAGLIPTTLSAYVIERRAEIGASGGRNRRIESLLLDLDELEAPTLQLHEWVDTSRRRLKAQVAFSAFVPAAALTGEAIALFVVATGASTASSFVAVMVSLALVGSGAVFATADTFVRLIEPRYRSAESGPQ